MNSTMTPFGNSALHLVYGTIGPSGILRPFSIHWDRSSDLTGLQAETRNSNRSDSRQSYCGAQAHEHRTWTEWNDDRDARTSFGSSEVASIDITVNSNGAAAMAALRYIVAFEDQHRAARRNIGNAVGLFLRRGLPSEHAGLAGAHTLCDRSSGSERSWFGGSAGSIATALGFANHGRWAT